jgi:hypothetical protein
MFRIPFNVAGQQAWNGKKWVLAVRKSSLVGVWSPHYPLVKVII